MRNSQRTRVGFTKLQLWGDALREYDKVVFMDSDTVVLRDIDHLFLVPEMGAHAHHQMTYFNAGVMVLEPNPSTYKDLMAFYHKGEGFYSVKPAKSNKDGGKPRLYFSDQSVLIPFFVNRGKLFDIGMRYNSRPGFEAVRPFVYHFAGDQKPWELDPLAFEPRSIDWYRPFVRPFIGHWYDFNQAVPDWWELFRALQSECRVPPGPL